MDDYSMLDMLYGNNYKAIGNYVIPFEKESKSKFFKMTAKVIEIDTGLLKIDADISDIVQLNCKNECLIVIILDKFLDKLYKKYNREKMQKIRLPVIDKDGTLMFINGIVPNRGGKRIEINLYYKNKVYSIKYKYGLYDKISTNTNWSNAVFEIECFR